MASPKVDPNSPSFYVYQLRIEDQIQPFYVGKGHLDRAYEHFLPSSLNKKSHKNNTIKKAYKEGKKILVDFIESDIYEWEALGLEITCISLYGRIDKGTGILTNNTDGGEGAVGVIRTKEQREHLSQYMKTHPISEEQKRIMTEKRLVKVKCLYCNVDVNKASYARYHKDGSCLIRERREKQAESKRYKDEDRKSLDKVTCEHCNKQVSKAMYSRWHGTKCKQYKDPTLDKPEYYLFRMFEAA